MQVLEIINAAIASNNPIDEAGHLVDALRFIEASDEDTRRLAIQRIDDHVRLGKASRGLVNLLITLRRVA
jgi:hypothetical protein